MSLEKFQMFHEIREQPGILDRLWNDKSSLRNLTRKIPPPAGLFFSAFGSSYNAALYGQTLAWRFLGIPSLAAAPGFFLGASKKPALKNHLFVAVSQSGKVREVLEAARLFKKYGVRSLALTNEADSPLARLCDEVVLLRAGREKSVPATKTFTATLFNLQLLCGYWGAKTLLAESAGAAEICRRLIEKDGGMKVLARKLLHRSRGFMVASEWLKPVACEGALKLDECADLMTEPFDWREFFHGPVALARAATPVVFLPDPGRLKASRAITRLFRKHAIVPYPVQIPAQFKVRGACEAAVPYAVLLQLLALNLAVLKGRNPDHPRGLRKITQTPIS